MIIHDGKPIGDMEFLLPAARREGRERWEVRAAQWKALELARDVFGPAVRVRLGSYPARGAFRGMLHVHVPFRDFEEHERRERRFSLMAGDEELLRRVPLVYAFQPDPALVGEPMPASPAPREAGGPRDPRPRERWARGRARSTRGEGEG